MDELIKKTRIVEGALVKAVMALLPGESIERVLDETRTIILKRILNDVKDMEFPTVFHLAEYLKSKDMSLEDATVIMRWLGQVAILDSGLLASFFKYSSGFEAVPEPSIWCCTRPKTAH